LESPETLASAKAEFDDRMKDRKYTTQIPNGQSPPKQIR
jgi:hypothetical protein